MPYRKRRFFRRKRRTYRRKRARRLRKRGRPSRLRYKGNFISDQYYCKLSYADTINFSSTSGAMATQQYQFNNLQDPDYTNSGSNHQPMGYDQLTGIYEYYQVYGVKYNLKCIGASDAGVIMAMPSDGATIKNTSYLETMEQAKCNYRFIEPNQKPTTLKGFCSTRRVIGASQTFDVPKTATGSSVTDPVYLNILYQTSDATTTSTCEFVGKLTFYCKFSGRKQLTQN